MIIVSINCPVLIVTMKVFTAQHYNSHNDHLLKGFYVIIIANIFNYKSIHFTVHDYSFCLCQFALLFLSTSLNF